MKDAVINLFEQHQQLAVFISLVLSIVVAVLGLLPSVFITAANIIFFGFWQGTLISFIGETIGAAVAFFLYRKGFRLASQKKLSSNARLQRLIKAKGKEAFVLILSLRLIPFVPSGLVTFVAAIGSVSSLVFILASSIGKIPALMMEAYSVNEVTRFSWQGKLILFFVAAGLLYYAIKQLPRK